MSTSGKKFSFILLGLLLAFSLFFRLYRLSSTQTFLEDEGRDLLIVKRMVDTYKPVLLGPQTSIGSMYLGPFYYYFITPALVIAGMDPIGPAILIAITGTLTVLLLYFIVRDWFGERAAAAAAILYAFMPLPVWFTRNSWNPNLAPLISLGIIWVLDQLRIPGKNSHKYFGILGLLTGILIQLHYMALVFVAIYALIVLFWWRKSPGLIKAIFWGLAGFGLAIAPFIIFEIRNDWVNTNAIIRFIEAKESSNIRYTLPISLWYSKVVNVTTSLFGGLFSRNIFRPFDVWSMPITVFTFLFSFAGVILSTLDSKRKVLLGTSLFGSIAILGLYQENIHVHYLGFLFVLCYMAFVSMIGNSRRIVSLGAIIITIILILYSLPVTWGNIAMGETNQVIRAREVAAYIAARAAGTEYNIVSSPHTSTTPYQYFAFVSNHPPTNNWTDRVFMICENQECTPEDMAKDRIFLTGPAHPSLVNYVGHPLANFVMQDLEIVSNEHVSHGIWVSEIKLIGN